MNTQQRIEWAITHLPPNLIERFIRAIITQPSGRVFSYTNPFATSFNTAKTFEGNDFWYEKTKEYINQKLKDCTPFSKKKKYQNTLFIVILNHDGEQKAFPIAYTALEQPVNKNKEQIEIQTTTILIKDRINAANAKAKTFKHLKGKHNIHIL